MRLASRADFYDGPIYTQYRHHEGYAKRARLFRYFPEPILVVGCGFGFLVEEFKLLAKSAWGIDASQWAINNRVNERVKLGDILDIRNWELGEFAAVVTEDLLPCLTDNEALLAARNCQALSPIVVHLVTEQGRADLNYHSTGYWMSLTSQLTVSLEGM
jgi:2-polyprenyl-3-methyl-5-hydroxy-6-metoxy-1,4-benzoquinol methylase